MPPLDALSSPMTPALLVMVHTKMARQGAPTDAGDIYKTPRRVIETRCLKSRANALAIQLEASQRSTGYDIPDEPAGHTDCEANTYRLVRVHEKVSVT